MIFGVEMKKTALLGISIFVVLFVIDIMMANWANRRIIARDADFAENYDPEALDWDTPGRQFCKFRYELWIYAYQTCFYIPRDPNFITYAYHPPRRRLSIWAKHNPDAYYFQVSDLFPWKEIRTDGVVKYRIRSSQLRDLQQSILGE